MIAVKPGPGHRLSALLLLLLVIAGFYGLVSQVLIARYYFYQDRLEQQQGRLAQLQRIAATGTSLQQLIDGIRQDPQVVAQYLPQSAPPLAAANLQQHIKTIIEGAGATLRSTQALPPVEEGRTIKVTVSASMVGDSETLRKILYVIESQTPLLFVDNLDVIARDNRPRLPNGRLASYSRVQLTVQIEVSGYLRKEGG